MREKAQMTQSELAAWVDVDMTYISKIENNALRRPPSEKLLINMARVLGLDTHEYLAVLAGQFDLIGLKTRAQESIVTASVLRAIAKGDVTDDMLREAFPGAIWYQVEYPDA